MPKISKKKIYRKKRKTKKNINRKILKGGNIIIDNYLFKIVDYDDIKNINNSNNHKHTMHANSSIYLNSFLVDKLSNILFKNINDDYQSYQNGVFCASLTSDLKNSLCYDISKHNITIPNSEMILKLVIPNPKLFTNSFISNSIDLSVGINLNHILDKGDRKLNLGVGIPDIDNQFRFNKLHLRSWLSRIGTKLVKSIRSTKNYTLSLMCMELGCIDTSNINNLFKNYTSKSNLSKFEVFREIAHKNPLLAAFTGVNSFEDALNKDYLELYFFNGGRGSIIDEMFYEIADFEKYYLINEREKRVTKIHKKIYNILWDIKNKLKIVSLYEKMLNFYVKDSCKKNKIKNYQNTIFFKIIHKKYSELGKIFTSLKLSLDELEKFIYREGILMSNSNNYGTMNINISLYKITNNIYNKYLNIIKLYLSPGHKEFIHYLSDGYAIKIKNMTNESKKINSIYEFLDLFTKSKIKNFNLELEVDMNCNEGYINFMEKLFSDIEFKCDIKKVIEKKQDYFRFDFNDNIYGIILAYIITQLAYSTEENEIFKKLDLVEVKGADSLSGYLIEALADITQENVMSVLNKVSKYINNIAESPNRKEIFSELIDKLRETLF